MECAIDALIEPLLAKLYLVSQGTLDTRMISADLRARDGHPVVRLSFEHWLGFDQVEDMHARGLGGDVALVAQRENFARGLPDAICATFDAEALAFFDAGGEMDILVVLKAVDGERKADATIDIADVTIHGCGVS